MVGCHGSACGNGVREQNVSVIHGTSLTGGMQITKPQQGHTSSSRARCGSLEDVVPDQCINRYVRQQLCLPDPPTPYLFQPLDTRQTKVRQYHRNGAWRGGDQDKSVPQEAPEADAHSRVCTIDGRMFACEPETSPLAYNEDLPDERIHEMALAPFSVPYGILSYHNVKSKRRFCTPPSRPEHLRRHVESLGWPPQHHYEPHGDPPPSAQTKLCNRQTANHSIGTLLAHESLVGPVRQDEAAPPSLLFAGIPAQYNCHSSMRRISWQRTLRSAMAAADSAQQSRDAGGPPWVSPAQLAAYSMALQLPPPAGFKHPLLRYPVGCGFTQRVGYPFSAAPAQFWTNQAHAHPGPVDQHPPAGIAPARVPHLAQPSGAADALILESGLGALSQGGVRGGGTLPQILEERSEEGWPGSYACGHSTRSNSGADGASPRGCAPPGDPPVWDARHLDSGSAQDAPCAVEQGDHSGAGEASAGHSIGHEADSGDHDRQLAVAGGSSLAGPAPLEAQVAQQACHGVAWHSPATPPQQESPDGAGVAQEACMEFMIPQRGAHGPVLARVAGRPELQYAALDTAGDACGNSALQGRLADGNTRAAEGSGPACATGGRGTMEIDMFSWINDRAVAKMGVGRDGVAVDGACSPAGEGPAYVHSGLVAGLDGGERSGAGLGGRGDGAADDVLVFMSSPAGGQRQEAEHSEPSQAVTLPRLSPLADSQYDGWSDVTMHLSAVNTAVSHNRPRMSDVAPALGRTPVPKNPEAEQAWRQVLSGAAAMHPGSELSIVRPQALESMAALPARLRAHSQSVADRQLPPITPCTTPLVPQERRPPSVGGKTCGSGLGDRAGSLTVKLSTGPVTTADGGADGSSPLWKLLPQQAAGDLASEASQRRLELAEESLQSMHDDKVAQRVAAAGAPGGGAEGGKGGILPQLAKDVDELLRHDAGLRMALALQGQSGAAGVHVHARGGGLKMHRSRGLASSWKKESVIAAWKG